MTRAGVIGIVLLICADSSGETEVRDHPILPVDAAQAIDATSCPETAGVSVEACLVWLNSTAMRVDPDSTIPPSAVDNDLTQDSDSDSDEIHPIESEQGGE